MKLLAFLFLLITSSVTLLAQQTNLSPLPRKISYQAIVRQDTLLWTNQEVIVLVNILNASNSTVFEEVHKTQTNSFGLVTLEIGAEEPILFRSVPWLQGGLKLKIDYEVNGELIEGDPVSILAIPYAFVAEEVVNEKQQLTFDNTSKELKLSGSPGSAVTLENIGGTTYNSGTGIIINNNTISVDTSTIKISGDNITNGSITLNDVNFAVPQRLNDLTDVQTDTVIVNQYLRYDGVNWVPSDISFEGANYQSGSGIEIDAATRRISLRPNVDDNKEDDIIIGTPAGGDLTGIFPNPRLKEGVVDDFVIKDGSVTLDDLAFDVPERLTDLLDVTIVNPQNNQILKWNATTGTWIAAPESTGGGGGITYVAGNGIQIENDNRIVNTGDLDPRDDLTISTSFGGAVSGTYNNLEIQPNAVASEEIANGTIRREDIETGVVPERLDELLDVETPDPQDGQILRYRLNRSTGIGAWQAENVGTGGTGDSDNQQLVFSGTKLSITGGNEVDLVSLRGTGGGVNYVGGAGIGINGNIISNIGDTDNRNELIQSMTLNGNILTINETGNIKTVDLSTLRGTGSYVAGSGISISNNQIINTGDLSITNELQTLSFNSANNQLTISSGNSVTLPIGSGGTTYTAGAGIQINGSQIVNAGDTNPSDDVLTSSQAGGDLSGTFSNLQIRQNAVTSNEIADRSIQGTDIAAGVIPEELGDLDNVNVTNVANGQVLKYENGQWVARNDNAGSGGTTYTAGAGIQINGSQIVNAGDTNAGDDVLTSSQAGGDLSGTFSNLQIRQNAVTSNEIADRSIQGTDIAQNTIPLNDLSDVNTANVANGQVLKYENGQQVARNDNAGSGGTTYTAGTGIQINGSQIVNAGDTNAGDDVLTSSQAGGDLSGTFSNLQIRQNAVTSNEVADRSIKGTDIAQNTIPLNDLLDVNTANVANGQVLKYENGQWVARNDNAGSGGTTYTAGAGIQINGSQIVNAGDTNSGDDVLTSSQAGGDLSGTFSNLQIRQNAVTSNEIADRSIQGTDIAQNTIPLNDLLDVNTANVANGQVLKFENGQWVARNDNTGSGGTTYTAGAGIQINGSQIVNAGDTNAGDDVLTSSQAGGDLSGTFSNLQIRQNAVTSNEIADRSIQGTDIAVGVIPEELDDLNNVNVANVANGQVLKYENGQWVARNDNAGTTYTAGAGIRITGNQIINTGDPNPFNELLTGYGVSGDSLILRQGSHSIVIKISDITGGNVMGGGSNSIWNLSGNTVYYQGPLQLRNNGRAFLEANYTSQVGGSLSIKDVLGIDKIRMFVNPNRGYGHIETFGENNSTNVSICDCVDSDRGYIGAFDDDSDVSAEMYSDGSDAGIVYTAGRNGFNNVILTYLRDYPDNGYVGVYDNTGTMQAGMYVDETGRGVFFKDQNSFRMEHPTEKDKDIWYTSIEGPEAAAYERGTAELVNGEAFIPYSETFGIVINPNTVTVQLTAQSAESLGLAVVEKTATGFKVKELMKGTGNYAFDWEVKGVRKGYEDYKVIQDRSYGQPGTSKAVGSSKSEKK